MVDETSPDCHHFSVRRRIAISFCEISSASDNLSVANDHCAERIITLAGFIKRQSHEAFVIGRSAGGGRKWFRRQDDSRSHCDNHASSTVKVGRRIRTDKMYMEAHRVIKPGGTFAVYAVLQGEGGEVLYPVPWARDPSIGHLETPDEMKSLLIGVGFKLLNVQDSTEASQNFFRKDDRANGENGLTSGRVAALPW